MTDEGLSSLCCSMVWILTTGPGLSQTSEATEEKQPTRQELLLDTMHSTSSHRLFDHVQELASAKYDGRLTGTPGYDRAADWVVEQLKPIGVRPAGDNGTYFQRFPNPYTLVREGSRLVLHVPGRHVTRSMYFPVSTST